MPVTIADGHTRREKGDILEPVRRLQRNSDAKRVPQTTAAAAPLPGSASAAGFAALGPRRLRLNC